MLPQILYLSYFFIATLIGIINHGNQYTYNAAKTLFLGGISIGLLIWGGFFATFGLPQIIYIIIWLIGVLISVYKHGERSENKILAIHHIITIIIVLSLTWWGGFYDCFL